MPNRLAATRVPQTQSVLKSQITEVEMYASLGCRTGIATLTFISTHSILQLPDTKRCLNLDEAERVTSVRPVLQLARKTTPRKKHFDEAKIPESGSWLWYSSAKLYLPYTGLMLQVCYTEGWTLGQGEETRKVAPITNIEVRWCNVATAQA